MTDFEQLQIDKAAAIGFYSEEAEQAILGDIIAKNDKFGHFVTELTEDDFYDDYNKVIFKAVQRAKAEGIAIDLVTISEMLYKIKPDMSTLITQTLIDCVQKFTTSYNADSYLRIVKELSVRRRALKLVSEIQTQLKDPTQGINGIMDKLRTNAGDMLVSKHGWVTMSEILMSSFEHLEKRVKGDVKSITTGIKNVDAVIGGFFGGEMTIIGARPAVGKSVFGMNVAMAAARSGFKVGICSREMTDIQFGQRIISYHASMDGMKIRNADIEDDDWITITDAMSQAAELPIEFLFTVRTVEDLRAEVQRKANKHDIDMLIVDYLQLMSTSQNFKEDRLRVGYISKMLKDIAVDFNIPVIALAQVKRYAGGARAKMPTLEDLKDSGNLEQDADGVIFLHNPYDADDEYVDPRDKEYFDGYIKSGYTYLCLGVAKQRQGATGKACVLFDKRTMHYYAIDRNHTGE